MAPGDQRRQRLSLLGASFSGGVCAYYAAKRAAEIDRLVLLNPQLDYKKRTIDSRAVLERRPARRGEAEQLGERATSSSRRPCGTAARSSTRSSGSSHSRSSARSPRRPCWSTAPRTHSCRSRLPGRRWRFPCRAPAGRDRGQPARLRRPRRSAVPQPAEPGMAGVRDPTVADVDHRGLVDTACFSVRGLGSAAPRGRTSARPRRAGVSCALSWCLSLPGPHEADRGRFIGFAGQGQGGRSPCPVEAVKASRRDNPPLLITSRKVRTTAVHRGCRESAPTGPVW